MRSNRDTGQTEIQEILDLLQSKIIEQIFYPYHKGPKRKEV